MQIKFILEDNMTQKEILYIEDALNHCQFLRKKATDAINNSENKYLRDAASDVENSAQNILECLYNLIG